MSSQYILRQTRGPPLTDDFVLYPDLGDLAVFGVATCDNIVLQYPVKQFPLKDVFKQWSQATTGHASLYLRWNATDVVQIPLVFDPRPNKRWAEGYRAANRDLLRPLLRWLGDHLTLC